MASGSSQPLTRLPGKVSQERVANLNKRAIENHLEQLMAEHRDQDPGKHEHHDEEAFWAALERDLDNHSKNVEELHKKASKLAETVKTIKIVRKHAGRIKPNDVSYQQVTTKNSKTPFR